MTDNGQKTPHEIEDPAEENSEQDERGTQAQDVAADALASPYSDEKGGQTEHGGSPNPAQVMPLDEPDLVDRINNMANSGRIDMGAFEGEEPMDDEDGSVPE